MKLRIVLLAAIAALNVFPVLAQTTPRSLSAPGLRSDVTVRRDGRGIPYIEAKNDADLYFAQGYITAGDRLWQMDLMRRVARGETAELFGQAALDGDKRWRRFGFAALSESAAANITGEMRVAMEAYANGVNAFIATLDDKTLPVEFKILQYKPRAWTVADSLVIGAVLADALSNTWQQDLLRQQLSGIDQEKFADLTDPVTPFDVVLYGKDKAAKPRGGSSAQAAFGRLPAVGVSDSTIASADYDSKLRKESLEMVGLYAEGLAASNNWVVSSKRTADGKAMLANDPHLAPSAPGIWYLASLQSPTVHAAGVTVPGLPAIIIGHNEKIAWGMTNVGPDVQDIYLETVDGDMAGGNARVKTPNGFQPLRSRKEKINVRGNLMKPDVSPVEMDVYETHNGPIVLTEGGKSYSLKWTALNPKSLELGTFYKLNRAGDWQEFQNAIRGFGGSTQNFVYADIKGNIGWYASGQIPIRRKGDGSLPYDGSTADGDWTGMIPFEELPHLYNPPAGFIVTANQRIAGTDYKYQQMTRVYGSDRARRIYDLLSAKKTGLTMDDSRDIQHDVYNWPLAMFAKTIVAGGFASAETLAVLKAWDGKMTPDSRGAVLANEIRTCVGNRIAEDNKPVPAGLIQARIFDMAVREQPARWLPSAYRSYGELYRACDASARTNLAASKVFGSDPAGWVWGKSFTARFPHQLAAAPLIGGQFATPNVPIAGSGRTPNVGSNVSMRLIASPGNWDATRHVIPLGESGDPKSPHYKDQFDAWKDGTPMIFPFSKAAVEKATTIALVMSPK
ncbi:MAG: penicillin acylase family protein [Pyrinomonadaceae bacterium]|nr:penicillin acylase family protein [Pyrinomonadaceae bacterium]